MNTLSLFDFADKINEIVPEMMKEFIRRQTGPLYKMKVTLPQFMLLVILQKEGETKMKDLAHFMNVTTAAITGIVERLVRDGYVVRAYEPEDRRIIKINATAKGSQLVNKVNQQRREMIIKTFAMMPESDRQEYLRILTKIRDILVQGNTGKK